MNHLVGIKEDGTPFLTLVLEPGNIHRIKQHDPILVHIEDWFPDGIPAKLDLYIHYSETPMADAKEFVKMSEMSFDERTPKLQASRPHCPECRSTIEQIGQMGHSSFPMKIYFCPMCGCTLGVHYDSKPEPAEISKPTGKLPNLAM